MKTNKCNIKHTNKLITASNGKPNLADQNLRAAQMIV